jgi:hypothetical protein
MSVRSPYWTKVIDELVSFCDQYYLTFRQSIRAASAEEIKELEDMVGLSFPPEYDAFLRAMGNTPPESLGDFLKYSTYGIQTVKDLLATPGIRLPRDAVYLWTFEVDAPYDIFIRIGGGERDLRPLVQIGWPVDEESGSLRSEEPDEIVLGGSLPQALYKDAFLSLRDPLLPHGAELRERWGTEISADRHARRRAEFQAIATRLGFEAVPFMNDDLVFYNRPNISLKLYGQVGADVIYVRADDERELARTCEILSDNLDVVMWG